MNDATTEPGLAEVTGEPEFAALTSTYLSRYVGDGLPTSGNTWRVEKPHWRQSPETVAEVADLDRRARWLVRGQCSSLVAGVATLISVGGDAPHISPSIGIVGFGLGMVVLLASSALFWPRESVANRREALASLTVPPSVGPACRDYRATPARLRALGASEATVAAVEERLPHLEDLVVESARLLAADALDSEAGVAVTRQIAVMAAEAQALTVLARRRQQMIAASTLDTEMLLARQPDSLSAAAADVAAETRWLARVLDPAPEALLAEGSMPSGD